MTDESQPARERRLEHEADRLKETIDERIAAAFESVGVGIRTLPERREHQQFVYYWKEQMEKRSTDSAETRKATIVGVVGAVVGAIGTAIAQAFFAGHKP